MSNIIRLPRDKHHEAQMLLPWYVTGRLDVEDRARVDDHLKSCAKCRADLKLEQLLEAEFADLPMDVEQGWTAMRRRVEETPRGPAGALRAASAGLTRGGWRLGRAAVPWLGWVAAAGLALVFVAGPLAMHGAQPARYHVLSAPAPAASAGNVLVIFRPDASEAAITEALRASDARLVDGPTAADAYLLRAPAAERDRTLVTLRERRAVVLAEPIDGGGPS